MSAPQHDFDEALISGYLDGELTQGDAQRVRIHLETCNQCRQIADEFRQLTDATSATEFRLPEDTQWDERPRTTASRIFHNSSLVLGVTWLVGLIAYLVWQTTTDTESIRFESGLALGLLLVFGLVFLSTLVDRIRTRKNDPYRKVKK